MNGVNWDGVRAELRPRAAAAKSDSELRAVVRDMLGRLGLSHFALIPSSVDAPHDAPRGSSDLSGRPGLRREARRRRFDRHQGRRPGVVVGAPGLACRRDCRDTDGRSAAPASRGAPGPSGSGPGCAGSGRRPPAERRGVAHRTDTSARARRDRRSMSRSRTATGRRSSSRWSAVPSRVQPVTVGSLPTMFVRVESEREADTRRDDRGCHPVQRVDGRRGRALSAGGRPIPRRRRHRHRSPRESRRACRR